MEWLRHPAGRFQSYSELNLNQYSVGSPCHTICTVCGSSPCPDLNLIHYTVLSEARADFEDVAAKFLDFGFAQAVDVL